MATDRMTIIDAMRDPALFGPWFKDPETWIAWRAFLVALFGLPMCAREAWLLLDCTGRHMSPTTPFNEAWLIVGRRGGKSFIVALIAVFLACFRDYSKYLAPGERGTVMVIATDRKQARVIFRYIHALIENVPMLKRMVERSSVDAIDLVNNISIEIHTASFRSTRGYTVVAALLDEVAFWRDDTSANPDREIVTALSAGMATIPNALLIGLSSPYARRGVLWEKFRDYYGKLDAPLVWQADTLTMNPTIPQKVIDAAYANDPAAAAAEYGAQFRSDIAAFLNNDWIDAATVDGRHELSPLADIQYRAFCDPSGGGSDAFTLGIAHLEGEAVVLDVCRARRPPFSPDSVVSEFSQLLKAYGLNRVTGDRYAGQWVVEAFGKYQISYEHSSKSKSEIYLEVEPLFAQGAVRLLDNRQLQTELRQLERRTARGGKDSVDHPPRGHDDLANAACGAFHECVANAACNINFLRDGAVGKTYGEAASIWALTNETPWAN